MNITQSNADASVSTTRIRVRAQNTPSFCCHCNGLQSFCTCWPLTPGAKNPVSSTQLPLTGHSVLLGPSSVNPRDGCASMRIPVDREFVKRSVWRRHPFSTSSKSLKIPFLILFDAHFVLYAITKCCGLRVLGWLLEKATTSKYARTTNLKDKKGRNISADSLAQVKIQKPLSHGL